MARRYIAYVTGTVTYHTNFVLTLAAVCRCDSCGSVGSRRGEPDELLQQLRHWLQPCLYNQGASIKGDFSDAESTCMAGYGRHTGSRRHRFAMKRASTATDRLTIPSDVDFSVHGVGVAALRRK